MSLREVVIADNGGANTASLSYALERLGAASQVSADPAFIRAASHVILPGVGAAGDAMSRLARHGLDALIPKLEQPVLGICLGMQLLHEASEEDAAACLGIIPGRARRLAPAAGRPVPHMGWNTLDEIHESPLLEGIAAGDYAYFVHSYALAPGPALLASTSYGTRLSACVGWRNFYGVQFHPERSGAVGSRLLDNFLAL